MVSEPHGRDRGGMTQNLHTSTTTATPALPKRRDTGWRSPEGRKKTAPAMSALPLTRGAHVPASMSPQEGSPQLYRVGVPSGCKPSSRLLSGFAQEAGTSAGVLPNRRDRIIVAIPPRMIGPR